MSSVETSEEPFGTFRLPAALEALRRCGNATPDTFMGRRLASLIRRICLHLGGHGPFDIPVFENQNARVYPRTNRCEKRAFSGLRSWDRAERDALEAAIAAAPSDREFVFVDAGANVGFYSLFAVDAAMRAAREARILAIEPDPINRGRLYFNIQASQCGNIAVSPYALGGSERVASLESGNGNRGEVRLRDAGDGEISAACATQVTVRPLASILADHNITRIDALKMDIEGVEHEVLDAFFASADFDLWPEFVLLEVGRSGTSDAYELCRSAGYQPVLTARINSILRRPAGRPAAV